MEHTEVLVAGGGAAGMMAALAASKNEANVLIIERMNQLGKKILATGNGKCNYTNYYQSKECYRGDKPSFAHKALQKFGHKETINLFKSYGILPFDNNGYVYPITQQASSVRDILNMQLESSGIDIHTNEKITGVHLHINKKTGKRDSFIVSTDKSRYLAKKLIITTGGKASPFHGSDGFGYKIAIDFGHSLITPLPALTFCIVDEKYTKDWAGARTWGSIKAYSEDGNLMCKDFGGLQFVAQGISGIPVFQVSRYISKELSKGKKPYLIADIMPLYSEEELVYELLYRKEKYASYSIGDIFKGMLNNKLTAALLKKCSISIKRPAKELMDDNIKKLAYVMKNWHMDVKATGDFDKAQVTCGGINTSEINVETMESKICKGLYFAGEVLDIDGICGGYNLQWAWTSGYIAGSAAGKAITQN